MVLCKWVIIKMLQMSILQTLVSMAPPNKNAPQDCEAFGAENEARTLSCNMSIINDLGEF